mmetsp:Transcript_80459/g.111488  ORF Transcript_80459/g.111488 Transcript_80459/m.111488 type:complete len:213 (+) Transcript_80459:150-788(+)
MLLSPTMRVLLLIGLALGFRPGFEHTFADALTARTLAASSRRELLAGCGRALMATTIAAAAGVVPTPALADKSKGYMTMDEYNKIKAQKVKDERLYGKFEALRSRATQTVEFDKLAEAENYGKLSELARGWENSIRKELMESATKDLDGETKTKAESLNKLVLADLKSIDKLAKASAKGDVPSASSTLRQHVLDFVALEPSRLQEQFGVGDL